MTVAFHVAGPILHWVRFRTWPNNDSPKATPDSALVICRYGLPNSIVGSRSLTVLPPGNRLISSGGQGFITGNISGVPLFLGTAETPPKIEFVVKGEPVYTDESGTEIPGDIMYNSEMAIVTTELNWYDPVVCRQMADQPFHRDSRTGLNRFGANRLSVGTLILASQYGSFELWMQFPYFRTRNDQVAGSGAGSLGALGAMAGVGPGFYFPTVWLEGPRAFLSGAIVQKVKLVMVGYRMKVGKNNWLLYSQNSDDFKPIPDIFTNTGFLGAAAGQ